MGKAPFYSADPFHSWPLSCSNESRGSWATIFPPHFLHSFYKKIIIHSKSCFFHPPCLQHRNTKMLYSRLYSRFMVWGPPSTRGSVRFTSQWLLSDHISGNAFASLKPPAQSALHGSASNPKYQLKKCSWPSELLAFRVSNMSKT